MEGIPGAPREPARLVETRLAIADCAQVAALARSREALSERALLNMADSAARVHPGAVPLLKLRCLQAGPPASAPRGNHRTNAVAVTSPLTSTPIGMKRCSSSSSLGTALGSPCRSSSEQLALRSADDRPRCRTLARNRASAPGCAAPGTGSRARAADGVRAHPRSRLSPTERRSHGSSPHTSVHRRLPRPVPRANRDHAGARARTCSWPW